MWVTVTLRCHVVWNDAHWSVVALWQDDTDDPPIVLERSGVVPISDDTGPPHVLAACAAAFAGEGAQGSPLPRTD